MTVDELRTVLRDPIETARRGFSVVSEIARLFAGDPESQDVQELILRALEHRDRLNGGRQVLVSLARERGLFPYLREEELSLADQIAYEFHRPPGLGDRGIVFHGPQARVYWDLMNGRSVILSAPTSFGKSLIIDAIVLSRKYRNILIVAPTIALMDETRRRLGELNSGYKLITHVSQNPSEFNLYIMTQERAIEHPRLDQIDFFVIDEFYKLAPSRGEDERADILNQLFYKLATAGKQFYMLGPSIQSIPPEVTSRFECKFLYEPYHTVVSELHRVGPSRDEIEKVIEILSQIDGPSIVYCRSPRRAATVAKRLAIARERSATVEVSQAANWMASEYHPEWHLVQALRAGVGVHHGRIPKSLSQYVVSAFERDVLDVLVCTSSLIEGVNTKAKNVLILDDTVSREKFDYFTFNNIRGRSGRMFKHFVGNVYLFHPPPAEALPFIDVPSITQSDDASDGLLLQLNPEELDYHSRERMRAYTDQTVLSLETLRLNAGVDPEAQIAIADGIGSAPARFAALLGWRRFPSYEQLEFVSDLMFQHFDARRLGASSVLTSAQLAFRINQLRQRSAIKELIRDQLVFLRTRNLQAPADDAVQNVLDFLRLWPGFHFPRLLMAIHRIQREVLPRYGYTPGDFSVFAGQVENLFLDPVILALEEYGLPIQVGIKLVPFLSAAGDLDTAIERLKNLSDWVLDRLLLTDFERMLLQSTVESL
jgi:hypothetical protein